jgi:hypothetical protein
MNIAGVSRADQQALTGFLNQKKISQDCKTADEVGDASTFAKALAQEGAEFNCKMTDLKTTGNRMTFTSTCVEDGERITGTNEVTFGADSFTAVATIKDSGGRTSTVKQTAKRVGECKP